jgi:hypothetical protein
MVYIFNKLIIPTYFFNYIMLSDIIQNLNRNLENENIIFTLDLQTALINNINGTYI